MPFTPPPSLRRQLHPLRRRPLSSHLQAGARALTTAGRIPSTGRPSLAPPAPRRHHHHRLHRHLLQRHGTSSKIPGPGWFRHGPCLGLLRLLTALLQHTRAPGARAIVLPPAPLVSSDPDRRLTSTPPLLHRPRPAPPCFRPATPWFPMRPVLLRLRHRTHTGSMHQ